MTIDGKTHPLSERFMVVATQNPIEQQGIYPLPEAQLDRFLFKQILDYPERRRSARSSPPRRQRRHARSGGAGRRDQSPTREMLATAIAAVGGRALADEIVDYIVALVRATRETADLETGASPRAGAMLAPAARARAALDGRDYVIPDDVKALALPALRHRVILSPAAEIEGRRVDEVVAGLVERIEAPR